MNGFSHYQAAKHLKVAPRTVAKWIEHGRLSASGERDKWRVSVDALNTFCDTYGLPPVRVPDATVLVA